MKHLLRPLGLLVLVAAAPSAQRAGTTTSIPTPATHVVPTNHPPTVRVVFDPATRAGGLTPVGRFELIVEDPDGDLVWLKPVALPQGFVVQPVEGVAAPVTRIARWLPKYGPQTPPAFLVSDGKSERVEVLDLGVWDASSYREGDVTGDGVVDVVAPATAADLGGTTDVGALYVWPGGSSVTTTPVATLMVPGASAGLKLGSEGIRLIDLDGDDTLDIVVPMPDADVDGKSEVGVVFVWLGGGGLSGSVAPTIELSDPDGRAGDRLGDWLEIFDLDGDGNLDMLSVSELVDVDGARDSGGAHFWSSVASSSGRTAPDALLVLEPIGEFDGLTATRFVDVFADVTGDGREDLLLVAPGRDVPVRDAGVVCVWDGTSTFSGRVPPTAVLSASDAASTTWIGSEATRVADVTGDGVPDVVSAGPRNDYISLRNGAVFVWEGGPGLVGAVDRRAVLVSPYALNSSEISFVELFDLDGDGVLDIVSGDPWASVYGGGRSGALFLWYGGPSLQGTRVDDAALFSPNPASSDNLGSDFGVADVTGDGVLDVFAGSSRMDIGAQDSGGLLVWSGTTLSGTPAPIATLVHANPQADDEISLGRVSDLDGDGVFDLFFSAWGLDVGGVVDAGGGFAWKGGPGLTGTPAPAGALSVPGAVAGDRVFLRAWVDLTGDGRLDVIANSSVADVAGVVDAGAYYVFPGESLLGQGGLAGQVHPSAILSVPGAPAGLLLGNVYSQQGAAFVDVTGDGVVDLVAGSNVAPVQGVSLAGAAYLWPGGAGLSSATSPFTLTRTSPQPFDQLGDSGGAPFAILDLDGDGSPEILEAGRLVDVGGTANVGAISVWDGSLGWDQAVHSLLHVPGAAAGDRLTD